ncbi:MAG: hypothetical protein ACYC6Y_10175, partial [Thermoguttaceae bacterium]
KQLILINNSRGRVRAKASWSLATAGGPLGGTATLAAAPGDQARHAFSLQLPADLKPGAYEIEARFECDGAAEQIDSFAIHVLARPAAPQAPSKIALFDPQGETAAMLTAMGVVSTQVEASADLAGYDLLVVGRQAITLNGPAPNIGRVRQGLKVLVLEQSADVLEKRFGFRIATYGLRQVFKRVADHPALAGLGEENLRDWCGEATLVPAFAEFPADPGFGSPADRWCGIPVTRLWRCGNRGNVASVLIEKPARGDFFPILDGGYSLEYSPLLEYREGLGAVLFCQLDVTGRTRAEPAAEIVVRNLIGYLAAWQPTPRRQAVYAGSDEGRQYLEATGIAARPLGDGPLSDGEVLVVAAGAEGQLADCADAVRSWILGGGRALALGLGEQQAGSFLPDKVSMKDGEHIATWFEPFGPRSLLAGVSPADVHNAAPRTIRLLTGEGAVGDGVLGQLPGTGVVLLQMTPYSVLSSAEARQAPPAAGPGSVTPRHNLKRTFRRLSFAAARLLANMGVAAPTPILERFSTPLDAGQGQSVVKNGDFALDADNDGRPDGWELTTSGKPASGPRQKSDAPGVPWALRISSPAPQDGKKANAMLAQYGVPMKEGQWYRISLLARAEGLEALDIPLAVTNTARWQSLFDYQRFTPDAQWKRFQFEVRSKETVEEKTRLQIWYEGAGTVWIADVRIEPIADPTQGRWLEGLYADAPEEWDFPYRFFRW